MLKRLATTTLSLTLTALAATAAWAGHPSLDGRIEVRNDRHLAVSVAIDGAPAGNVGPQSVTVLDGIPNGLRLVRLTSPGLPPVLEEVSVPVGGKAVVALAPLRGRALIENGSGVTMRLRLDGNDLGRLAPGMRLETPPLLPGDHRLVARPADAWAKGGPAVDLAVRVDAGRETPVRLAPWLATLEVVNPTFADLVVFVDGHRIGHLSAGGRLVLARQVPGAHRVSLRTRGRIVAESVVLLSPGEDASFRPQAIALPRGKGPKHHRRHHHAKKGGLEAAVYVSW